MRKENKTKEQLIHELAELRQQVDKLKKAEAERLSAGQAGKQAEEALGRIFNLSSDMICISGFDGYAKRLNPAFEKTLGYTNEEILAKPFLDFVHPDDRAATIAKSQELAAGTPTVHFEQRCRCKDGSYKWLAWTNVPVVEEGLMYAVARDITEQKKTEHEVEKRRLYLEKVLTNAPDAIVTLDAQHKILEWNAGAERLFGYTLEEVFGRNIDDLITGSDPDVFEEATGFTRQVLAGKSTHPTETIRYRKDGSPVDVIISGSPILMGNEVIGVVAVYTDITEHKQAEDALREARRRMESLHEIACQVDACETEDEIYRLTVKAAEEILDFSMCTLDIVEGNKLVVKATSSELPPEASRESGLDEGGLAAKTYRTGETYIFGSLDEVPEATPTREDFKSGLSAPIGDIGVFQVASTEANAFSKDDARLLELLLGHTTEGIKRIRLQNQLREQATRDSLTGVFNRRYFTQTIESELERSKRYGHPISFLMLDVNRFKEMNDRFGHQVGDRVLQQVAKLLGEQVRKGDTVIRYGGDEFLIVLPETNGDTDALVQRIHNAVAERNKENLLTEFPITLAIGKGCWRPESAETIETILHKADQRMYEDKKRLKAGGQ